MGITHRPLCPEDLEELKSLHEEWFPVRYSKAFYESVVHGVVLGSDAPLFSLVAVDDHQNDDDGTVTSAAESMDTSGQIDTTSPEIRPLPRANIIGAVIAQIMEAATCGDVDLAPDEYKVLYILTLGTASRYRRQGVAKTLVQRCISYAQSVHDCAAVYLHVITYNTAAISFYKDNGFQCLREIADYYLIDQMKYNCYLYIHYTEKKPPKRFLWFSYFFRPVINMMNYAFALFPEAAHREAYSCDTDALGDSEDPSMPPLIEQL
uniref:N-alpha-acetyltransferase 60 n=1 Tax=Octactis speculum TaxID=3111310 RepID=A0A7S2GZ31_9STRA|mmetsp:Transcript_59617/g.81467  ORF Transcript_59617/g.81467 Transcript_59617/m.81467 type:complete len:264 (+) Transcript_59617:183-974(+)